MSFQDGPTFVLRDAAPVEVLARYQNGKIAAAIAPFGCAVWGSSGHIRKPTNRGYMRGLTNPDGIRFDLGHDLIESVSRVGGRSA